MSLPINHSSNSHPFIFALAACALTTVCEQTANADELEVPLERTGIVYSIGHVESVINRGAVIDLGDAHTLRVAESVALIRQTENYFTPVGILRISETYPTFCHAHPSSVKPQNGDIVIFIREFSDLKTPEIYREEFLQRQLIKNSGFNGYSTRRRSDTAMALLTYTKSQPKWEKSKSNILGYMNGSSFAGGGETSIKRLLNQINMFREHYRAGRNSLPASGRGWTQVMSVLAGKTATLQHNSTQVENADDEFQDEETGPSIRDIKRAVAESLFDRTVEERNLLSFVVATALEDSPRKLGLWLRQQAEQSQFPTLSSEDVVLEVIQDLIREFRDAQ